MDAAVADFVREHYPASQTWEDGALDNWLAWAGSKNFLFICYDSPERKQILGLVIARPVTVELAKQVSDRPDDKHDMAGPIIYVDLCISTGGRPVLKAMLSGLVEGFKDKLLVGFFRYGRTQIPKIYSFRQFSKSLLGDNYGQRQ